MTETNPYYRIEYAQPAAADATRPLELEIATYNERAKAFYRKYGFKEVEGSEHLIREVMPVVVMRRAPDGRDNSRLTVKKGDEK